MKSNHILLLLLTLSLSSGLCFSAPGYYVDVGLRQESGDFNSGQDVTLLQLEASYGLKQESYDFSVFIAYQKLSEDLVSESGAGDIILRAGKELYSKSIYDDSLYMSAALKLPTADENKGLGSGETDVGGFLNYTQRLDAFNLLYSVGYIFTGDSTALNYNDILSYGIGISKLLDSIYVYSNLQGRQQTLPAGENPLELVGGLFYALQPDQFIRADILFGLSDASSDFGISIGVTHWF